MGIRISNSSKLKERRVYTFENFRGVDFSTSPYKVLNTRATYAQNLIYENGTVRKRTGWVSLCKLPARINGLFSFELENEKVVLAYAGTTFYSLIWDCVRQKYSYKDITNTCTFAPAGIDKTKLIDQRIQIFLNDNKAYIIGCGDYLVFGKWGADFELRRVYGNEDTYIPTTSINIDNDSVADEARAVLDSVNILTPWRINKLLGADTESATWTLDAPIINESDVAIEAYTVVGGENIKLNLSNRIISDKTLLYAESDIEAVGRIDFLNGKITLNINTKPQEADSSNIIVKFQADSANQEDFICKSTFGAMFGAGGNSNRLFIAGNNVRKNVHMWSEMYDFTYFPDINFDEIGGDSSAIVGYVRVTDGIMLAFKENNGSEATIYYISGTDTQDVDADGNPVFVTKFTKKAGNIADTIWAQHATASLNGDNLILTRNGVKGLEMYDNVTTSAYRVRERGRNINSQLLKHENLKDACGFVYKNKYYLSLDGVVYVCDSRFTFQAEEDVSDSFNYEWWYWTNVDARIWAEIDNCLLFGTNSGLICKFTDEIFADITHQNTEVGDLSISYVDGHVFYNTVLEEDLTESDYITFTQGDIYCLYLAPDEMLDIDNEGWISIAEETLPKVYEGIECYADNVGDSGLRANTKYFVGEINLVELKFRLRDEENNIVLPQCVGFRLSKYISNKPLYLAEINHSKKCFKVKEFKSAEPVELVTYNSLAATNVLATVQYNNNVCAMWYTPICDLGTNMYSKTLLGISVTTEPLIKGEIVVGYQTRNIEKTFVTHGSGGFDFNDIDFDNFSFESSFTTSNTIRVKERNFNFIVLRYVSDNQKACAVNGITMRYKVNRLNKGVR